jgi:hypothetical protein
MLPIVNEHDTNTILIDTGAYNFVFNIRREKPKSKRLVKIDEILLYQFRDVTKLVCWRKTNGA